MRRRSQNEGMTFGYDTSLLWDEDYLEDLKNQYGEDTEPNDEDYQFAWEYFVDNFQMAMDMVSDEWTNGAWFVEGTSMGWRNTSGEALVVAKNAEDLLRKVMPDTDYTVKGSVENGLISMIVYHHDSPTGEGRSLYPLTEAIREEKATEFLLEEIDHLGLASDLASELPDFKLDDLVKFIRDNDPDSFFEDAMGNVESEFQGVGLDNYYDPDKIFDDFLSKNRVVTEHLMI